MDASFVIKLVTIPLCLWLVSELSWRWGNLAGALLAGLPCISGPISLFLTIEQGREFGAVSAFGSLPGIVAAIAYGVLWAWFARRLRWWAAFLAALACYLAMAAAVTSINFLPVWAWALAGFLAPVAGVFLLPAYNAKFGSPDLVKRHSVPVRQMLAGVAIMAGVTGTASLIGPRWSGILFFFPIICSVVGLSVSFGQGANALTTLLRGAFSGMTGASAFIVTVGLLVRTQPLWITYGAALSVSLGVSLGFVLTARHFGKAI